MRAYHPFKAIQEIKARDALVLGRWAYGKPLSWTTSRPKVTYRLHGCVHAYVDPVLHKQRMNNRG